MLSHIDRSATIFTAKRQTLQHAQRDQDDRGGDPPGLVAGQQTHEEGREAHDQDRRKEGVLPADQVTQHTEHQRAERAHKEASRESQKRKDVAGAFGEGREELRADDRGERAIEVEVIPFEDRPGRGGHDDLSLFRRHRTRARGRVGGCVSHVASSCSSGFRPAFYGSLPGTPSPFTSGHGRDVLRNCAGWNSSFVSTTGPPFPDVVFRQADTRLTMAESASRIAGISPIASIRSSTPLPS